MAENHTVAQGEHLLQITSQYGFQDYTIVWDHANNAALKAQRENPNVLQEGDNLYIPDKELKQESGATSARHSFQVKTDKLMLRLVLEDRYEKPVANAPTVLLLSGDPIQVTTDGTGKIEQEIAPDLQQCVLTVKGDETPFAEASFSIKIGHLDPADTISGQCARLNTLGYAAGTTTDPNDADFVSAVQEFQCDQSLTVDGNAGAQTQAKLKQVHGC